MAKTKIMRNIVYVIHELDLEDKETDVIGVASSLEKVDELVSEYYGDDFVEISFQDIRDSTLEWSKVLEIKSYDDSLYYVKITVQWFEVDSL